ncbi:MAG: hypothetical protein KAX20_03940 [Candidatus Omnitrophica bacterium]|nr:hypothetical protein [Candidatus Omnitrophota bacterium]
MEKDTQIDRKNASITCQAPTRTVSFYSAGESTGCEPKFEPPPEKKGIYSDDYDLVIAEFFMAKEAYEELYPPKKTEK